MKPSEKLILMLELNNYNIDNIILKKQIECKKSRNLDLHNYNNYSDLIIYEYLYEDNEDYTVRNPLSYKTDLWKEVESLDQLVVKHPDVGKKLSIKDFLSIEIFSDSEKKDILNGIMKSWVNDYRETTSKNLKDLQRLFFIITKNDKYKKPSKVALIVGFLFLLFNIVLFTMPQIFQFKLIPSLSDYIDSWNQLLQNTPIYTGYGAFVILLFALYAFQSYSLFRRIKGIMREKESSVIRKIYKWDIDMEKAISKQSRKLEKYVDLVIKKPDKSRLDLKTLSNTEILQDKYKLYVKKTEKKYAWMSKNYNKNLKRLRVLYFSFMLFDLIFIGLAYVIIRGLINV